MNKKISDFNFCFDFEESILYKDAYSLVFFKIIPNLLWSLITGIIAGVVVGLFNILMDFISAFTGKIYAYVISNAQLAPLLVLGAGILGLLMCILIKRLPEARGSGVSRCEAMARGNKNFKSRRLITGTFVGTSISFAAGLSVGVEGPSVQLGAGVGAGVAEIGRCDASTKKRVVTSGIASGFAVAFGVPLAGIIFALEDVRRHKFDALTVAAVCIAVLGASAVNGAICGVVGAETAFLSVSAALNVPLSDLYLYLILGAFIGAVAVMFSRAVTGLHILSKKKSLPEWQIIVPLFMITAIIGLLLNKNGNSYTAGSGSFLIKTFVAGGYASASWQFLLVLLIAKAALILFCFRSETTGGMMVPMLTLGALVGALCGNLFVAMGMSEIYFTAAVLVGMAVFLGTAISAPFTAMVFLIELAGFGITPPLVIASAVAYLISRLFRQEPIYDKLI